MNSVRSSSAGGMSGDMFVPTRWTLVERTRGNSPEARAALSDLCGAYYAPVVAFLRRSGCGEDTAREQAHEFFAHLLERDALGGAEPGRGRFRSYLLGALKHFLARAHESARRQKRGGGSIPVPLDAGTDSSSGPGVADAHALPPDEFFDRQWALAMLDRALAALERECSVAGKAGDFARMKPWLTGDAAHGDQAVIAQALGMSEGAVKVAIHRLRRRFRALMKAEVAQTLARPEAVEDEMRQLFTALGG